MACRESERGREEGRGEERLPISPSFSRHTPSLALSSRSAGWPGDPLFRIPSVLLLLRPPSPPLSGRTLQNSAAPLLAPPKLKNALAQ